MVSIVACLTCRAQDSHSLNLNTAREVTTAKNMPKKHYLCTDTAISDQPLIYSIGGAQHFSADGNEHFLVHNIWRDSVMVLTTAAPGEACNLSLFNALNREAFSINTQSPQQIIHIDKLPSAFYTLVITDPIGRRYYDKVVVMH